MTRQYEWILTDQESRMVGSGSVDAGDKGDAFAQATNQLTEEQRQELAKGRLFLLVHEGE